MYQRRTWDEFKRFLSVAHASQPVERAENLEYRNQLSGLCWGAVYCSSHKDLRSESIFWITLYFVHPTVPNLCIFLWSFTHPAMLWDNIGLAWFLPLDSFLVEWSASPLKLEKYTSRGTFLIRRNNDDVKRYSNMEISTNCWLCTNTSLSPKQQLLI